MSFYADQAALYGVGGNSQNLFHATYQWYADGVAITGANAATLQLPGVNIGKAITVQVSYTNGLGLSGNLVQSAGVAVNGITDLAANVSTYLDTIEANHAAIRSALASTGQFSIYDGANTPVMATAAQLTTDAHAISLILDRSYLVGVADTTANLLNNLDTVVSNASHLSSLTITDTASLHTLAITSQQALIFKDYFSTAFGHNLLNSFSANEITSMAKNSDGSLLMKVGGVLTTLNALDTVLFKDCITNIDQLTTTYSALTTAIFKSTGGINGNTVADLYTGPSSLNLKYQLIEDVINAVVTGTSSNEFIKVSNANSIGKAVDGNGGSDVIDGGVGSTFVTGGANHSDTFFLDGRASGTSWSTITDFKMNVDKATIWGFVKGVSSIDTAFTNYNNEGATGYQGLTLHFKNLLPDGQTAGSNPNLNSITFTGHTLAELGASSLADLNTQINNGTNAHILVGATQDAQGIHSYLYIH